MKLSIIYMTVACHLTVKHDDCVPDCSTHASNVLNSEPFF